MRKEFSTLMENYYIATSNRDIRSMSDLINQFNKLQSKYNDSYRNFVSSQLSLLECQHSFASNRRMHNKDGGERDNGE